jgi:hypothetical protein
VSSLLLRPSQIQGANNHWKRAEHSTSEGAELLRDEGLLHQAEEELADLWVDKKCLDS